ncbi:MAG: AEC family transporter [Firmicutes bacterium]|nr:AEC family transporter [Bacillota bacterium]
MEVFLYILSHNILPIMFIVCLGFVMGKCFPMDVKTLSKLNFYVFVPAFTFYQVYTTVLPDSIAWVLVFALSLLLLNHIAARFIGKLRHYDMGMRNAMMNALMFYNSGNIGIPLITLVFSGAPFIINGETPYLAPALALQVVVLIVQNLSVNTLGFYNAGIGQKMSWKEAIISVFKMPTVYAIPLAFFMNLCVDYDLTTFSLWAGIKYLKEGLVPIALFTLGVQLSRTQISKPSWDVILAVIMRLAGGPLLALLLIGVFRFDHFTAQVLMMSSAVPTALNSALIAVERDNHPQFASQAVLYSTLLSPITLTFVVYISRMVFPI